MDRLDALQVDQPRLTAPARKAADGPSVGSPGIRVADLSRKEFKYAFRRLRRWCEERRQRSRICTINYDKILGHSYTVQL